MNFIKVFKKFDYLGAALNFVIKNSDSLYSPYHNLNHNITVTVFSYYLGISEKISEQEMKEVLTSAMLHDFGHTAGESKDDVNIKNAKKGIKKFVEESGIDVDLDKIYEIVDATEFPYKIDDKDLTIQQKIIRDADMAQLFESNRLQSNYLGLQKEMKIDYNKQLENQKKFYKNLKFRTKLGKELFKAYSKEINEELEYLMDINKK